MTRRFILVSVLIFACEVESDDARRALYGPLPMLPDRRPLAVVGLLVLASCFRGPNVKPLATLSPASAEGTAGSKGPFAVVHAAPRGRVVDRAQPGVTVMFSRGVRSVEMADDQNLPTITITDKSGKAVPGGWRWTGTRGLLFTPQTELPGGNDFTVTVPPTVRALDGSILEKPYVLSLETEGPRLSDLHLVGPAGITERAMPPNVGFRLEFDQSVDPSAVHDATTLRIFKADGDKGEIVRVVASRDAAPPPKNALPDAWVVLVKPEKPLPLDHQVELVIASTLRGTGGPRPMETSITRTMRTHGPLRFVDFYCARIEPKGRCRANGDVKVMLSNPVAPEELKAHVRTGGIPARPPGKEKRKIDPAVEHWLGVAPKLGARYRVTLTAGMKDVFGQKLDRDHSFDLAVEAPLVAPAPAPVAAAPEEEEAERPRKRPAPKADLRPRRERLPYQLDLGVRGQILEAATTGRKIPIGSVNVPTYSKVATSLTEAQAMSFFLKSEPAAELVSRNGFASTWTTTRAETNERAVEFIDLDAVLAPRKGRGPALLVVSAPGLGSDTSQNVAKVLNVTDLGVTAKMSPFGGLVWVTQLSSGKPVAGANVAIRTAKGGDVFAATSDKDGLAIVPADKFDPIAKEKDPHTDDDDDARVRSDAVLVVRAGDDWTMAKIATSPVETRLTSGFQKLSRDARWAGMVFADRGVFRPGETAKVSGIVRVVEPQGLRSIPGRELRVQLADRNSEQIFDGRAKCDDFGTFAMDLPIPKNAEIGTATITMTALPGGAANTSETGVFRHDIRILAYKPNEFKVTTEADKPFYVRGETATFTTQGDYLYGAPMQGAAVMSTVSRQEIPFTPPNAGDFTVTDDVFTGDYPDETKAAEEVDSQDGTLDEKGRFARRVDLAFQDQRRPERVVFDAEVQDLSKGTVSSRTSVVVHPGEFYAAIKTPKDRFVAAGAPLHTEVAAIDPLGARRAGVKIVVELVERRWNAVTGEQPDGKPMRQSKPQDTVASSCSATTTTASTTCDVRVPRAGYFIVRATATDARGNTVRSSTSVLGTEDAPRAPIAWASDDRHGIKVETNKPKYAIGETAKVLLRSPFKEGQALVTVERNGVLWRSVVPIRGPVPVVEIPVKPELYPNAFVSVVALRGRVQPAPITGADLGGPDFRFGYAELHVEESTHRLQVDITPAMAEYAPGATVEADVMVKDVTGKPASSALTFYVVDEGVLALTSYTTPDPLPAFVKRRKLAVFTFDTREGLARIVPMKAGERVAPLGYEYALARNPGDAYDKGDDGGSGGETKRADFRTTAYFEAGRKTDANGKAHFSFKLPDNLTTFRLMAVVAGADDRFGSGEAKVTTFRRLMARPALPRILRVGDALEASVVVSSKDDRTPGRAPSPLGEGRGGGVMNVTVKIDAKGVVLTGPSTRTIPMQRGGQAEVRFPVKATAPGEATVLFDVRSGSDSDRVEVKRAIDLPVSVESKVVYGETGKEAAIALGKLDGIRPDYGGLEVRVASSALVGLGTTAAQLDAYPYDCTEQVTSKIVPLVFDVAKENRDPNAAIDAAIETILKRQGSDGGFGFWDKGTSEPWLSAYTMLVLAGAMEKKRFVPKDVIERGKEYLAFALAASTRKLSGKEPDADDARKDEIADPEAARRIEWASGALLADTLASIGSPNPGAINVLYDARAGQRLFGQAALLHAMAKAEMSAAQIKTLSKEIEARLRIGPNGVDVDEETDRYGAFLESHARTLAGVLRAFIAADPKHPLAQRIARSLLALRRDGGWRNTQEDGWALLALGDYRKVREEPAGAIEVQTYLGGSEILKSAFARGGTNEDKIAVAADILMRRSPTLAFAVSGAGTAFFSAELKYATTTLPKLARDEGLFVKKYVRGMPAAAIARALSSIPGRSADAVDAGDLVIVDLLFETAEPRDRIVIDDPLPAGLEALDYDIDTTNKARRDAEDKADDPKLKWLGATFRSAPSRRVVKDDRVLTYFDHVDPGMYRVHYLARAASMGSFVVPPTRIEPMYAPEVYGRTPATSLVVRPKPPTK
jgi:alpha-2-macroglobulin